MTKRTGRVERRRDYPGALLVRARIDEDLGGCPSKRFLQPGARQREQLRYLTRLPRLDRVEQPDNERAGRLPEEEVGTALTEGVRGVGNQGRRERLGVHRLASGSELRPWRPRRAARIERV